MKQSPFLAQQADVPEFMEWGEMTLPARYRDPELEYETLVSNAGAIDVSGLGVLRVTGTDAEDYLHRMLSNTVKGLQPGSCNYTTLLRGDGRLVGDAMCCRIDAEDFLLLSSPFAVAGLQDQLERLIITESVEVRNLTEQNFALELLGPDAVKAAAAIAAVDGDLQEDKSIRSSGEQFIIRFDRFGLPQFLVIGKAPEAGEAWKMIGEADVSPAGMTAREALRIESGIPLFGRDMDKTTIPLEANLYEAVDFTKGCFPGQEIVARINNLGHPANRMIGWLADIDAEIPRGSEIKAADSTTGKVTSVSPRLLNGKTYGLGYVKWNHREPGVALTISTRDGKSIPAKVIVFPNSSAEE